jgi:hypothetical protein
VAPGYDPLYHPVSAGQTESGSASAAGISNKGPGDAGFCTYANEGDPVSANWQLNPYGRDRPACKPPGAAVIEALYVWITRMDDALHMERRQDEGEDGDDAQ